MGLIEHRKECGSERVGWGSKPDAGKNRIRRGGGKRKVMVMFAFLLLVRESEEGKGGEWRRMDMCRER